ncbi:MAG: hypothetical protein P4M04_15695 [Acidobacteriota bacterium]|nr:hypothetical protein [Acidobacteriota bacterium]
MRNSLRSSVLALVVLAYCLIPWAGYAADSSAATTVDPTSAAATAAPNSGTSVGAGSVINPTLVDLLVKKGILTSAEANSLRNASGSAGMEQLLLLLKAKGVVNDSEVAGLKAAAETDTDHTMIDTESNPIQSASLVTGQAAQTVKVTQPAGPVVIPAIAPLRVLPVDPAKKDGLAPALTLGAVRVTPYGFVKATAAYDSSLPRGDDFVVPGFLNADTGPNNNPEFHIKARATRFGSKFEWPDISKNITVTGQIEADFEGNFSRADNRNVSTIRSNALSLRLAYGRIDWQVNPNTDVFFEAGQDWTIFGSSALPTLFETTFYGAYWGNVYERAPQMRLGFVQKLGGSRNWKFTPEVAIMTPAEGNLPADAVTCTITTLGTPTTCTVTDGTANQLGYGERQGADSGKPEIEARTVLQFQLDKAPGVVPAQVLWSGFYTQRQATVLASAVPTAYKTAFPRGVDANSNGYGNQLAASLPTRWFTLVGSIYSGADLRFFFGGQLLSNYNYTGGLTKLATGASVDNSSTVAFGLNGAGTPVVAPQRPIRAYGGFIQAGFPLSRWFNADVKGRNAGWQAYYTYGVDEANTADFRKAKDIGASGAGPYKSNQNVVTVFYKMNPWVTFGFEETKYGSYALPNDKGACTTKIAGLPNCTYTDWRTEFGPVFTF